MQLLAYPRETASLDGTWQAIPDQYEMFKEYFDDFTDEDVSMFDSIYEPSASIENDPSDFNIYDGYSVHVPSSWGEEIPEFRHFEGWVWYAKQFDSSVIQDGERTFLRFGAVNYKAEVWLNGDQLGIHEGGFTPFSFEITDHFQDGENVLVVRMDNNRYEEGIPNAGTDWFNFGGINRSVELVTLPETFIQNFKVETTLSGDAVDIQVSAWVDDPSAQRSVSITVPELDVESELTPDSESQFSTEFSVPETEVTLWSPSDPRLYTVQLEYGNDTIEDRVGLRDVLFEMETYC
jgi:beta-glucuronidase